MWRSKRNAAVNMTEDGPPLFIMGPCSPSACSKETACVKLEDKGQSKHRCLCTHDLRPPAADGSCSRHIVNEKPGRIPNVQPPSLKTVDKNTSDVSTIPSVVPTISPVTEVDSGTNLMVPVTCVIIVGVLILVVFILLYLKRKSRMNEKMASPMNLKQNLLVAERYAPNPQYSACSGAGVPVLRRDTLRFLDELGEGCFGKVYKGEHTFEDDGRTEIVAIKVLKETASKEAEDDFYREVEIMSAFKHPNILLLLGVVLREGSVSPMMVFEYMRFGDLAEVLRVQRHFYDKLDSEKGTAPVLDDRQLLFIALQVAQGMGYLAAQRFVHRDLACRNCLVTDGPVVKIADFGMSRDVYTCDYYKIGGSRLLPVRWMSPESVVYGRFTLESDVWSYGVVLWEIYNFGKQPYYGHTNEEVMKLILDGVMLTLPEDCPSLIQDIMNSCWKVDPKLRITFDDIGEKLETAFQTYEENHEYNIGCEYERKHKHGANNRSLPRPPPLRMLSEVDILDSQGYLLPKEIKDPIQYLETL